jgi:hypothetical protein
MNYYLPLIREWTERLILLGTNIDGKLSADMLESMSKHSGACAKRKRGRKCSHVGEDLEDNEFLNVVY